MKYHLGILKKLRLMHLLVFIVFASIILAVFLSFRDIESFTRKIINTDVNQVVANAQLSRDLNGVFADADLLISTFLNNDKEFRKEAARISANADALEMKAANPQLREALTSFTITQRQLFEQCATAQTYSRKLDFLEQQLTREISNLEETLSEKLVDLAQEGRDVSILEQLSIIIPGYRETLLQISLQHTQLRLKHPGAIQAEYGNQILAFLDDLHLRLRTLTASEPVIRGYGERLMRLVSEYKSTTRLFLQAMGELRSRLNLVNADREKVLTAMGAADREVSQTAGNMGKNISSVMRSTGGFIFIIAGGLMISLGLFTTIFSHRNIRRPMQLILQEIESIRHGNLETHIRLNRHDEWNDIEDALNRMVHERVKAEEKWHSLFTNLPGGSFTVNREYIIEEVNDVVCQATGYSREEIIGKPCDIICPKGPHQCPIFDLGKESIDNNETAVKARDGRHVPIIKSARKISTGNGDVIVENFQDITDRKLLEEQLGHAQKMEAVGQLAGGVAHDFNNILTAIIGYGNLLQMKVGNDEKLGKYIAQILYSAERAAHLTNSLLAFSRKHVINLKEAALNDIIRRAEKLLSRLVREDIELRVVTGPDCVIRADSLQIEQVLMNLVTNARDSMPEGGQLTISTERIMLDDEFIRTHGFGAPGPFAVISVSDTGAGIDDGVRERIFEPFFTTKETGKGTGLGLAIVYGIIKQHGGYIHVASKPCRGTTFTIFLPVIEESGKIPELYAPKATPRGSETVLLAEDEPVVRTLAKCVLEEFGYTVIEAVDGADAVEKFKENIDRIQLIILDVVMPKQNGKQSYDCIKMIRPDVKVLFMSGYAGDILSSRGILEENLNFIPKPLEQSVFLQKIRDVLDT